MKACLSVVPVMRLPKIILQLRNMINASGCFCYEIKLLKINIPIMYRTEFSQQIEIIFKIAKRQIIHRTNNRRHLSRASTQITSGGVVHTRLLKQWSRKTRSTVCSLSVSPAFSSASTASITHLKKKGKWPGFFLNGWGLWKSNGEDNKKHMKRLSRVLRWLWFRPNFWAVLSRTPNPFHLNSR